MSEKVSISGNLQTAVGKSKKSQEKPDKREWLSNKCYEQLLNRIFYPVYEDNIEFISILIDGSPGSGKTSKAGTIIEDLIVRIEEEKKSYNIIPIEYILQAADYYEPTNYNIVVIDDAIEYNEKLAKKAKADFNRVRHVFKAKTSRTNGVVIFIWTVQDGFRLEKHVRKQLRAYIFNSCPSDESDEWFIDRMTCNKGMALLRNWEYKLHDEHAIHYKGRCVISTPSWAGWCNIELPKTEFFRNLKDHVIRHEQSENISVKWDKVSGDYRFQEIERFDNIPLVVWGLENWQKVLQERTIPEVQKLKQKHIDAFILKLQGMSSPAIAEEFGLSSRQAIDNSYEYGGWLAIVRTEFIGHLLEWLLHQEGSYYEGYTWIAGVGRVDLLSPDKKKAIEVKARQDYETPSHTMLSNEMKKMLDEDSHECELCQVIIRKNKCMFIIFKIDQIIQKDNKIGEEYYT